MTHYLNLNAELNLYGPDGEIQTDKDKEAARQYFLQHVNQNYVFFHDLEEKIDYMVKNEYWSDLVIEKYSFLDIKSLFHAESYRAKPVWVMQDEEYVSPLGVYSCDFNVIA